MLSLDREHPHCTGRKIILHSSPKIQQPIGFNRVQRKDPLNINALALKKIFFYKKMNRRKLYRKANYFSACVFLVKIE